MNGPAPEPPASLSTERERTVDVLCRHFAGDALTLSEFERRLDRAHAARSLPELRDLLADLPTLRQTGAPTAGAPEAERGEAAQAPEAKSSPPAKRAGVEVTARRDTGFLLACLGGHDRKGQWTPPRHLVVVALMGGAALDFREADLPPGVTRITIGCVMGGVELIVPPDLPVDTSGLALLGGFDHEDAGAPADDSPRLEVTGVAFMGGISVETRLPGESGRDAKRRRRKVRKRLHRG